MTGEVEREAARVRQVYARRDRLGLDARYDYWKPANLFMYQTRERDLIGLLEAEGMLPLEGRRVLDVGCAYGGVLRDMARLGARPADLAAIDLLPERVESARQLNPGATIEVGDAQVLPFEDGKFGLVLGFTLLSSVTDAAARQRVASEMARVCAPVGAVVLYDFWVNPFNRDVKPLKREELRRLFPGWRASFRRTTLAPPLVRALAPLPGGRVACTLLEVIPFLRTHFVVALRPPAGGARPTQAMP